MNQPENQKSFFGFLTQALTLGARQTTNSSFPTLVGYLVYAAVVGLIALSVIVANTAQAIVASIVLLALLAILALLMILASKLAAVVLNTLVAVVVIAFVGLLVYTAVQLVPAIAASRKTDVESIVLRGNVFVGNSALAGADVSVNGESASTTTTRAGFFSLPVGRAALLPGDSVDLFIHSPAGDTTTRVKAIGAPILIRFSRMLPSGTNQRIDSGAASATSAPDRDPAP